MFATIVIFLLVLLVLRYFAAYVLAGMVHVLVVAAIALLVRRIRLGRKA
jgi:hypothetical protein